MWHLYILKCRDGSLYTGVALDVQKRIEDHEAGRGSKYVRSKLPVKLLHTESFRLKVSAFKREAFIKQLTRGEKLKLIRAA